MLPAASCKRPDVQASLCDCCLSKSIASTWLRVAHLDALRGCDGPAEGWPCVEACCIHTLLRCAVLITAWLLAA